MNQLSDSDINAEASCNQNHTPKGESGMNGKQVAAQGEGHGQPESGNPLLLQQPHQKKSLEEEKMHSSDIKRKKILDNIPEDNLDLASSQKEFMLIKPQKVSQTPLSKFQIAYCEKMQGDLQSFPELSENGEDQSQMAEQINLQLVQNGSNSESPNRKESSGNSFNQKPYNL